MKKNPILLERWKEGMESIKEILLSNDSNVEAFDTFLPIERMKKKSESLE